MRRLRALDERTGRVDAADVERDRHQLEAAGVELVSQVPPHGQVEAAPSPGSPREQKHLLPTQAA